MAWYKPWESHGNVARERRRGEIAERQAAEAATPDPYGATPPQWDEQGFPVGPMPKGKYALDYQYEANRRAEQRRMALWGDAQNSMRQGLDLFQSYRPGGSAAAASGMFGQKAGLYATQALNTSAPDLLIDWREQIRARAEENANELNRNAQLIAGLSSFNVLAGGTMTALQGQPAQPGPQTSQGGGGTYNVGNTDGSALFNAQGGGSPGPSGPGAPMPATAQPMGGGGALPGILPSERSIGGGSAMDVLDAGGFGGGGAPGGGSAGPGGPKRGAAGGPGGSTDEGGAGMGGAAVAGGGGLGDYSGQAVADRSLGGAPVAVDMTTSILAEDPYRQQSIALMAQSARQTLLDALALG